ncbi:MAG TPA: flippase [Terriglobales bacterium]|nr:flippase [Terriglobales bacterium]
MSAATNIPPASEISVVQPIPAEPAEFSRRLGNISRQSAVYFAGTILTAASAYFFKIYLARTLGAEALGLYALGMSIVGFLGLFNAAGLPSAASRFVAQYESRADLSRLGGFLRTSLGLLSIGNVLLGIAVLVIGPWIAIHLYHAPALGSYFTFFVLIMFFGVLNTFLGQAMAGYQDVAHRTVITHFIGTPANMVLAVIFIGLGFGLKGYLVAQVASGFLVLTLLGKSVWERTPPQARNAPGRAGLEKEVIAFSATAFGIAAVDFVLTQADKVVLGFYLDARQVGVYAVAIALVGFVPIALQSVNQIFAPIIAELHATGDHALLQHLYSTLTKWILILTLPLAFTMIIFSRPLIAIFGHDFAGGAAVLAIGALGQLFNCAVGSVGYLLLMSGNQLQLIKIQGCNALVMVGLSLFLVPRFGIAGAAIASAVSVTCTNLWSLAAVVRTLKLFPYHSGYSKLLPCAFASAAVLFAFLHVAWRVHSPLIVAVAAFVFAYTSFFGMLLGFGLEPEDREFAAIIWQHLGRNVRGDGAASY